MPDLAHNVYTDDPGAGPYAVFPNHAYQILSNCIHILGASILAFCFARRTQSDSFLSRLWWSNLSWARLLVILIFLDSWFFLAFAGVLVNGVGLSFTPNVCSLAIFSCIFFYVGSKILIYLFLVERVWIVCSAGKSQTRRQSRIYKACALICLGYAGVVINAIFGRYAAIRDDGVCIIGLATFGAIPVIIYDFLVNISLTVMFLWALYREKNISVRLRRLARRTAIASAVALSISCVNLLVLVILHGRQLGWVCLASCASDVTVNALVIFWVTTSVPHEMGWNCGGLFPWEPKDAYNGPLDLPPLNFPVSFVADPERGLSPETQDVEAGEVSTHTVSLSSPKSIGMHLVSLVGSLSPRSRRDAQSEVKVAGVLVKDANGLYVENGMEEKWDIAESSSMGHKRAPSLLTLDVNLDSDLELGLAGEQLRPRLGDGFESSGTHETGESQRRLIVDTRPFAVSEASTSSASSASTSAPLAALHQHAPVRPLHPGRSSSTPPASAGWAPVVAHHSELRTSVPVRPLTSTCIDRGEGPSSLPSGRWSGPDRKHSREDGGSRGNAEEGEGCGSGSGTLWRTVGAALGFSRTRSVQAAGGECDDYLRGSGSGLRSVKKASSQPFLLGRDSLARSPPSRMIRSPPPPLRPPSHPLCIDDDDGVFVERDHEGGDGGDRDSRERYREVDGCHRSYLYSARTAGRASESDDAVMDERTSSHFAAGADRDYGDCTDGRCSPNRARTQAPPPSP
ncbi:hypothetical protein M0805_002480 [Coniferiporia weirii]|nr:hypothetical protein M0805_002480 [Coniferiporia weirii]